MDFKRAVGMGQGTYLCRLIQVQIVHDVNELLQALGEARVKPPLLPHCRHRLTWGGGRQSHDLQEANCSPGHRSCPNWSTFRFDGIYKVPNKTRQKLYFAMILDLEHQRTPLTTRWVAHSWKQTFRTGLWMPIASHSEAGRGDSKLAKYPRQDQ